MTASAKAQSSGASSGPGGQARLGGHRREAGRHASTPGPADRPTLIQQPDPTAQDHLDTTYEAGRPHRGDCDGQQIGQSPTSTTTTAPLPDASPEDRTPRRPFELRPMQGARTRRRTSAMCHKDRVKPKETSTHGALNRRGRRSTSIRPRAELEAAAAVTPRAATPMPDRRPITRSEEARGRTRVASPAGPVSASTRDRAATFTVPVEREGRIVRRHRCKRRGRPHVPIRGGARGGAPRGGVVVARRAAEDAQPHKEPSSQRRSPRTPQERIEVDGDSMASRESRAAVAEQRRSWLGGGQPARTRCRPRRTVPEAARLRVGPDERPPAARVTRRARHPRGRSPLGIGRSANQGS